MQEDPVDTGRRRERLAGGARSPEPPTLPDRAQDDLDIGWGDGPSEPGRVSDRDEAWYRRERPPHHE
ncbi:MAG TPA: hypothetical protein VFU35_13875 [Jatrophihabitans sp.]|nr:hypothetical protein [Jatrophihabitans sp.]